MNKLYCIKMMYRGECFGAKNFWHIEEARRFIAMISEEWRVELVENNEYHMIWEAR